MTTLSRDRAAGKLLINGSPAVLRGGGYDVFFDPGQGPEGLLSGGQTLTVTYPRGTNPCQSDSNKLVPATAAVWNESGNTFAEFFAANAANHANFLRVFLFGGTLYRNGQPVSLSPFNRQLVGGQLKYDVRGAALQGRWNQAYFDRLRAFVQVADTAGVAVQLSLFNYFELAADEGGGVRNFSVSPWNAANSLDAVWGASHLIPNDPAVNKQQFFLAPGNELRAVQQEVMGKVMQSVAGLKNVVLEVMNEPHPAPSSTTDLERFARFHSEMTHLAVLYRRNLGAEVLISINASPLKTTDQSDLDVWKASGLANYADVDLVSYHGLTGLPPNRSFTACSGTAEAERVDPEAIATRVSRHLAAHGDKPLLLSTDAVLVNQFLHKYQSGALSMQIRDGQIDVFPESDGLEPQLLRTQVYHWAKSCFAAGSGTKKGKVHFHNHSTFRAALVKIGQAVAEAGL